MNVFDQTEQAYKNGYAKGYEDGRRDAAKNPVKRGHWIVHTIGKGQNMRVWAECSVCRVTGSSQWKRCPVCEAKMGGDGDGK